MRNFASYQVDVRHRTSGVIKTICNQCLPTRHNKRDRSLRVNIDTGHCHCYHCGADFYVPDDNEEREKAERRVARQRRAAAVPQHFQRPVFDASKTTLSGSHGTLAGRDALHPAVRHHCRAAHHGAGRIYAAVQHEGALRLLQLLRWRATRKHEIPQW